MQQSEMHATVLPKFSVATPTRNSLAKLKACVGSVRGQVGVDLEHIVQDAVSSDGTADWLARQQGVLWASEPDGGMYDAIERAWTRATGDLLSWLNSDEQYLPGTIAAVRAAFDAHPEIDFVYGNAIIVGPKGEPLAARREIPLRRSYVANGTLYAYSCTLFFRRRLFDRGLLRFDRGLRYAADADLILRILAAGCRGLQLNSYLSTFMLDGGNLSCSPRMLEEIAEVQRRHGAFAHPWLRKAVLAGRVLEKTLAGSFKRQPLVYRFALDELPQYVDVRAESVGGRFDIQHFSQQQQAGS